MRKKDDVIVDVNAWNLVFVKRCVRRCDSVGWDDDSSVAAYCEEVLCCTRWFIGDHCPILESLFWATSRMMWIYVFLAGAFLEAALGAALEVPPFPKRFLIWAIWLDSSSVSCNLVSIMSIYLFAAANFVIKLWGHTMLLQEYALGWSLCLW